MLLLRRRWRLRHCGFFGSSSGENAHHRVVAFVTGVLVELVVSMFQPNHERPGSRPRARVVHRDRAVDVGWADAREALGQLHIRRILLAAVGIQTYLKTYEFGFSTFEKHSRPSRR